MKTFLKKYRIFLLTAVFAVLSLTLGISAAYTNVNKVKRVISTQGGSQTAFSSNYMTLADKDISRYDTKRITFNNTAESKKIDVTVSNFARDNRSIINENNITYDFNVTLIDASGNEIANEDGFSVLYHNNSTQNTLPAHSGTTHKYELNIPYSFIEKNINIKIEAVPVNESLRFTDEKKLAKILTFTENTEKTAAWSGRFMEDTTDGYDGFNYEITGQGEGTISLTWDHSNIELNEVFLNTNNLTPDENDGKKTISWEVVSENGRYVIQFYKKAGVNYDTDSLKSYVELSFTPLPETTTEAKAE